MPNADQNLKWGGIEWEIKASPDGSPEEPGPNHWSKKNVAVEGDDLVLRITPAGGGRWACADLRSKAPLGYGLYSWELTSRVDQLDSEAVAGLFVGRFDGADLDWAARPARNVCGEIDIEFSRWSNPGNGHNSQYLAQPWEQEKRYRFNTKLNGSWSRHDFLWTPEGITFASYHGHEKFPNLGRRPDARIASWHYSGDLNPPDIGQSACMALWLHRGRAPQNDGSLELRVRRFRHTPLT